jgi:hypothetical protein
MTGVAHTVDQDDRIWFLTLTHVLQPLDIAIFGSFKKIYSELPSRDTAWKKEGIGLMRNDEAAVTDVHILTPHVTKRRSKAEPDTYHDPIKPQG